MKHSGTRRKATTTTAKRAAQPSRPQSAARRTGARSPLRKRDICYTCGDVNRTAYTVCRRCKRKAIKDDMRWGFLKRVRRCEGD